MVLYRTHKTHSNIYFSLFRRFFFSLSLEIQVYIFDLNRWFYFCNIFHSPSSLKLDEFPLRTNRREKNILCNAPHKITKKKQVVEKRRVNKRRRAKKGNEWEEQRELKKKKKNTTATYTLNTCAMYENCGAVATVEECALLENIFSVVDSLSLVFLSAQLCLLKYKWITWKLNAKS